MRKHTTTVLLQISSKPPAESSAVVFCHTRIPACLILASSSPYANYFLRVVCMWRCCFIVQHYSTVSTEIHSIILSMDLHVFACARAHSRENFETCKWKSRKLRNSVCNFRISMFSFFNCVYHVLCACAWVCNVICVCLRACVCVCVEHSLTLSLLFGVFLLSNVASRPKIFQILRHLKMNILILSPN